MVDGRSETTGFHPDALPAARLFTLLDGAEVAGIAPVAAQDLHLLAYMTNALAPVWGLEPLTPELLKIYGAPYDAQFQALIDRQAAEVWFW